MNISFQQWFALSCLFPQFRQEYLDTLYRYAKFQYECGNYSGAAEYLYFFRVLVSVVFYANKTASVLSFYFLYDLWSVK